MRSARFQDAFDKLAAAERQFLSCEFLAPMVSRGEVRVRIAGVVGRLSVTPPDFRGFGVFRPTSATSAEFVQPASLAQRRQYLNLFPVVRLVLCRRDSGAWLATPAHLGDRRFQIAGLVPVHFAEEVQQFDIVKARFDGANFWFDALDSARDPATAAWLRAQLRQGTAVNLLDRSGLTPEERLAYAVCLPAEEVAAAESASGDAAGDRLREALRHAGAELLDYLERTDGYQVTYLLDGQRHVSAVRKDDLTVQVAGICLNGEDRAFDLASLVGVLREAHDAHEGY